MTKNDRPVGIMISVEDAAETMFSEFFVSSESGYDEWLFGKVSNTVSRVADGTTHLHEHGEAMALLKERLETRVRKAR